MITQIDVTGANGSLLTLPLSRYARSYIVELVDGLDPVKATLASSDFAQMDGAQFQSSRRDTREIKFRIRLVPDYATDTVRGLRARLYSFFMPKQKVSVAFRDNGGKAYLIDGHVSTFETDLFSRDTVVDVSMICYDPDFREEDSVTFIGQSTPSVIGSTLTYPGSVETGVIITVSPTQDIRDFTMLVSSAVAGLRSLVYQSPIAAGESVVINTIPGHKEVTKKGRYGDTYSTLYAVAPSTAWPILAPGENYVLFYHEGDPVNYSMEYVIRHGGL